MQVQHLIQDPPMPHMPSETQQSGVSSEGSMQAHGCSISSSTSSSTLTLTGPWTVGTIHSALSCAFSFRPTALFSHALP